MGVSDGPSIIPCANSRGKGDVSSPNQSSSAHPIQPAQPCQPSPATLFRGRLINWTNRDVMTLWFSAVCLAICLSVCLPLYHHELSGHFSICPSICLSVSASPWVFGKRWQIKWSSLFECHLRHEDTWRHLNDWKYREKHRGREFIRVSLLKQWHRSGFPSAKYKSTWRFFACGWMFL